MAVELIGSLAGGPEMLGLAVLADLALGDPAYRLHPIRLMGRSLTRVENRFRRLGWDGYGGGVLLFVVLAVAWVGGLAALVVAGAAVSPWLGRAFHLFILYSLLALGDLLHHVWQVERPLAAGDLDGARAAIARLVGRDTLKMDAAACRRAAVETLSENLTDGYTSPLFWYAVAGLPGLVLFKVVSTMDSMVGYKTPEYLRFGWCGARLDDVMNYVPARLTWVLISMVAAVLPGCSARKALVIGWRQHGILQGPNSGWSEAATAGGIQRRIVGPIWLQGRVVTDAWIGDPDDPPVETRSDVTRGMLLVSAAGLLAAGLVVMFLLI